MAGAVCGQTLPVVVKAQTISRSDGPLSFSPPPIVLFGQEKARKGEKFEEEKKN